MSHMIDTHCHLDFDRYDEDREAVVERAHAAGVQQIIIPATDIPSCEKAQQLANEFDEIYFAAGIHPNDIGTWDDTVLQTIQQFAQHPKCVAIGEIGLDYYWDKTSRDVQIAVFQQQLALAARLELPVIIHNRESSEDVISILEDWYATLPSTLQKRPGVLHSFSGDWSMAERALAINFYLGFTGPITFKKAEETRRIAQRTPLERILVETDGPFLTPVPYRGKRNEPAYIPYIVEQLASLHDLPRDKMASITTDNAVRLFNLTNSV